MLIKRDEQKPVSERIVGERRAGIDRRVLTYDYYIPERRGTTDCRRVQTYASRSHGKWYDRRQCA